MARQARGPSVAARQARVPNAAARVHISKRILPKDHLETVIIFLVLLQNRLMSGGLEPVFYENKKNTIIRLKPVFFIRGKLFIIRCGK